MKQKMIAVALFAATTATVALFPHIGSVNAVTATTQQLPIAPVTLPIIQEKAAIEVVFVLDTTGSMGGLIDAAKEKIWSIASNMASANNAPDIRMGLVAYRDRGDKYVTRVSDLSEDLDSMYATLMDFEAAGGGDGPESVNQALDDAVNKISWSDDQQTYKVLFLVGDAPPHMDYQDDVKYPETITKAKSKGIFVNAIQCGENRSTTRKWQQMAQLGDGRYFQVEQDGGAIAVATPFDRELANLSAKLDETRLYYGNAEEKVKQQRKIAATEKLHAGASVASRARRATYNASESGRKNFLGKGELVDDVTDGRVDIESIDPDMLPKPMRSMAPEEQKAVITKKAQQRRELQQQIQALSEKRSGFIKEKVEESEGVEDSLDYKLFSAIKDQAEKKGLEYRSETPAY
ncbi:MAG: VWA domain-containing protein [Candidatus Sedimenticola sp. (ex Thyasira tokunagai)]